MGWEWHDRERDRYGRFEIRRNTEQLHLRLTPEQCRLIRSAARAARMEIGAYVWKTLDDSWARALTEDG